MLFTVQVELSPFEEQGTNSLLMRTLRAADWINCVSSQTLNQVLQRAPDASARASVIFNGMKVPPLSPPLAPVEPPKLLCVGRLQVQKGFDLAVSALAEIRDRFPLAQLIIAGDGPERAALERQTAELKLTHAVDFLGWVPPDEVLALIRTATVILMPSRYEGLPLVALEAAAMARPVVATRVSGLSEILVQEQTGLLIEPEDSAGLAEAIAFLLSHPMEAARMGRAARRRVQELFSWQRCVQAYDRLYGDLTPRRSRGR
jgi:glycogen synthase